ncbi:MAG: preQ(1) synthase [candidate division Zixibacteria bacterium]|nr:preQ(1) synthase [candidate division Zixibacteria bacterium]
MKESSYEGLQSDIRTWKTPAIETFDNVYLDRVFEITMSIPEFTCICPKTGLPDFAQLELTYTPKANCLELKSFKEYLLAYREKGIFHENVVNRMLDDIVAAVKPERARLQGVFNSRGGIQTTVVREFNTAKGEKS